MFGCAYRLGMIAALSLGGVVESNPHRTTIAAQGSRHVELDPQTTPHTTLWSKPRPVQSALRTHKKALAQGGPTVDFISTNDDPEGDMPRNVAFTPDGTTAVIVNRDTDNMTFFDVATRMITHTVALQDFPVDVAVTPDGQYAVAPNVFSNTISVVDIATHTVAAHVPITGDQPYRVAVTSDSSQVVVGVINDGVSSSFSIIDLASFNEVLTFPSGPQGVFGFFFTPESGIFGNLFTQFALSPDDSTIILPDRGNSQVLLYDPSTGVELAALPTAGLPTAVDISLDSTRAVVSHEGSTRRISVIDLDAQTVIASHATAANLGSQVIRITPDKTHAIAAISNNVIFVRLSDGATTATLSTGSVGDIEISFDGQFAFVSNFNARVINIATQLIVKTMPFAACLDSAMSPVEHRAVALNNRFREDIHLYNTNGPAGFVEGKALTGEPPEGDATRTVAVTPDGSLAVAVNNTSDNAVIIDLNTQTVRSYVGTGERSLGVAVTPDGTHAVVANFTSNRVSVIDLATDTEVANLAVFTGPSEVLISPDSQFAYVTTVAGADRIHFIELDGANSTVVGSLLTGQMGSIIYTFNVLSGIAQSPDGSVLAVCISFDDELMLIDTASRTEFARVVVGDFPIRVVFSPDGSRAYVVNSFGDNLYEVTIDGKNSGVEAIVAGIDFPLTVNVDGTGSFVYVGSFNSQNPTIKVVDTALDAVVATIPLTGASRIAHLADDESILYVATTDGTLVRIDAAGASSTIIDSTALTSAPSDMAFSDATKTAVVAEPIPDGVDVVSFGVTGDLDGDGTVGVKDLLILLGNWGPCAECADCVADLDGDCSVGVKDLLILLGNWG